MNIAGFFAEQFFVYLGSGDSALAEVEVYGGTGFGGGDVQGTGTAAAGFGGEALQEPAGDAVLPVGTRYIQQVELEAFTVGPQKTVGQYAEAGQYIAPKSAQGHAAVREFAEVAFADLGKFTGCPCGAFDPGGYAGEYAVAHFVEEVDGFGAVDLVQAVGIGGGEDGVVEGFHTV